MRGTLLRAIGVIGVVGLVLAGCSSDDKKSSPDTKDTTTTTKAAKAKPSATATPTTDLAEGALVTVTVEGFKPGLTLGINECASTNESEVGADDCNLGGIKTLTVGADGAGTGTSNVTAGPIGKNAHMCTAAGTRCFLSVGELVDSADAQRAEDIDLTFAG
jgi:hypothetical protein